MQEKYEEILSQKDIQIEEMKNNLTVQMEKFKFEIEYLRKENLDLMKGGVK